MSSNGNSNTKPIPLRQVPRPILDEDKTLVERPRSENKAEIMTQVVSALQTEQRRKLIEAEQRYRLEIQYLKRENAALQQQVAHGRTEREQMRTKMIRAYEQKIGQLVSRLKPLERELTQTQETLASAQSARRELQVENRDLAERELKARMEANDAKVQHAALHEQHRSTLRDLERMREELKLAQGLTEKRFHETERFMKERSDLLRKISDMEHNYAHAQGQSNEYKLEMRSALETIRTQKLKIGQLQAQYQALALQLQAARNARRAPVERIETPVSTTSIPQELSEAIAELKSQNRKLDAEREVLQNERARLEKRLQLAQRELIGLLGREPVKAAQLEPPPFNPERLKTSRNSP